MKFTQLKNYSKFLVSLELEELHMKSFLIEQKDGNLNIKLNQGVYLENAINLREEFESFPETYKDIIIEMGSVDYIDSTGLGVLISMQKKAEEERGTLYLKNISNSVEKILQLTRLNTIFKTL